MRFDEFVNALLKEAISSLPQKKEEPVKSVPKSISDITGVPSTQQVPSVAPSQANQPPQTQLPSNPQQGKDGEDDSTSSEALKQIADSAKDTKDFFAKLIATLTAQKQQAPATQPQTTVPPTMASTNPQNVISNLTKMA